MEGHIEDFVLSAESKALATISSMGVLNVVPVSSVKIFDGKIVLVNYFMDKTFRNILSNKNVSLAVWSKMIGYQIKGEAEYKDTGNIFESIVSWAKETMPERIVRGVIIITSKEVYDISPDKKTKEYLSKNK